MSMNPTLLLALLLSGCVQLSDSRKATADSLANAQVTPADSSPIPDKSLRPPPAGVEPMTQVRGRPITDSVAARPDTASSLAVIDSSAKASPTVADVAVLHRELAVPVAGIAASALHDSYTELRGGTRPHEALDILAPRGTPVLSASNGRVLKLFSSVPGGLMVYATDSTEHFILMYGHLDGYAPGLADGQQLRQGQQIGVVGTTGNAPANTPHLHFAIARAGDLKQWWKGSPVNPYPLLRP